MAPSNSHFLKRKPMLLWRWGRAVVGMVLLLYLVSICLLYEFHSFLHTPIPCTRDPVQRIGKAVQMENGQVPSPPTYWASI